MPRTATTLVRVLGLVVAALCLIILLVVSTGGYLAVVELPTPGQQSSAPVAVPADIAAPPTVSTQAGSSAVVILGISVVVLLVFSGILAWVISLRRMVGGRRRIERVAAPSALGQDELLAAVAEDSRTHLATLGVGPPRTAIVACWSSVELTMQRVGLVADVAETSQEFVQRVLATYGVDRSSIESLAALYREARFSEHVMTESARTAAIGAIQRLHDDLATIRR